MTRSHEACDLVEDQLSMAILDASTLDQAAALS
ncbi:MAG: hypothetical protein JWP25_6298 [Bradyrhizobium sp.]|jgi:hypothetical protein|nr:hypothetical protein [Bradyrhizobium sp.]